MCAGPWHREKTRHKWLARFGERTHRGDGCRASQHRALEPGDVIYRVQTMDDVVSAVGVAIGSVAALGLARVTFPRIAQCGLIQWSRCARSRRGRLSRAQPSRRGFQSDGRSKQKLDDEESLYEAIVRPWPHPEHMCRTLRLCKCIASVALGRRPDSQFDHSLRSATIGSTRVRRDVLASIPRARSPRPLRRPSPRS
jgi:hypothetical protein